MNEMDSDGDTEGIQPLKTEQFEIDTEAPGIATWTVTGVTSETVIGPNGYYNGNDGEAEHVKILIDWDDDLEDIESIEFLEGDVLIVQINADYILKFKSHYNLLILPDIKMSQAELEGDNHVIVEAIINQQS